MYNNDDLLMKEYGEFGANQMGFEQDALTFSDWCTAVGSLGPQ